MAATLRGTLEELEGVRVLDRGPDLGAIVTAAVVGWDPADLVQELRSRSINTSSQTRLDAVLDYDQKETDGALRVSPHYFNTEDDLGSFADALADLIAS